MFTVFTKENDMIKKSFSNFSGTFAEVHDK